MVQQPILSIQFHYQVPPFYFPERTRLKRFILGIFQAEKRSVEHINYIFCSDRNLLKVNWDYLKHDTYTDIITFSLSPEAEPILSDIYISIDRVKENARTFNSSFIQELHRVIFHGVL